MSTTTPRPERNADLLRKVADQIEREPESYSQGSYASERSAGCGTTCCIAGHAVLLGKVATLSLALRSPTFDFGDGFHRQCCRPEADEALGLTPGEAGLLFWGSWRPRLGLTVPDALRLLADGASIEEVSQCAP